MKSNVKALFLWFLLLVSISTRVYAQFAPTKPSVSFKVTRVVWGDNIDNPIKAHPGDSEVPLTIEVQNLSPNQTIKGVIGILILNDGPLEDVYGNSNVTATGEPEISEVLSPTDEIKPKGFFTLTFTLDIQNDALPGRYSYNMVIEYSVNCSGIFLDGESKTVTIDVIISKIESTISCSVSPKSVEKGELVKVSGSIEPTQENVTVTLEYKSPEGSIFTRTVRTDAEGSYEDSFIPHVEGYWSVNASWSGDEKHKGAWSAASFEVRFPVSLDIYVSKNRVVGGFNNDINVTITNSGKVALTEVELTINLPSPLIIQGDNKWRLEYLSPGNSSYIIISLFAPSSVIGSTYTASLSIDYRDDYGESHSETYPIGLIVVG
ncbi:TPA: hypothetical protein EYP70_05195, partial [Candidatus Bathyarchaeota archaeon]|nr:hypothetical protein [Candidatus Bathyarchaeota archaeon]